MVKNAVIDGTNINFVPSEVTARDARAIFARISEAFEELGSTEGHDVTIEMTPRVSHMLEALLRVDQDMRYNMVDGIPHYNQARVYSNRVDDGRNRSDIILRRGKDTVTIHGVKVKA